MAKEPTRTCLVTLMRSMGRAAGVPSPARDTCPGAKFFAIPVLARARGPSPAPPGQVAQRLPRSQTHLKPRSEYRKTGVAQVAQCGGCIHERKREILRPSLSLSLSFLSRRTITTGQPGQHPLLPHDSAENTCPGDLGSTGQIRPNRAEITTSYTVTCKLCLICELLRVVRAGVRAHRQFTFRPCLRVSSARL